MKLLVLLNGSAGALANSATKDEPERIRGALAAAGQQVEIREVDGEKLEDEARAAINADFDAIIAGGGDGTVNSVAAALTGTEKPMGVLPLGTWNHFANDLGIRTPLSDAARALAEGEVRAIDVGEVNGRVFVNNASIGLYPRVVGKRNTLRRRLGHGRWVAMAVAIGSVFHRFPSLRVRIVIDGQTIPRDTPFVFVGNNTYEIKLLALRERPGLDRGKLGLYFANRTGRFAMVRLAFRALLGRLEQAKDFEAMSAREFWIETGKHRLEVAIDGEVHRFTPPLHFRSRPRALKVIAPPAAKAPAAKAVVPP